MQSYGRLGNFHIKDCGLDYHLRGKFHPGGMEVHLFKGLTRESPQAAMEVRYRRFKKEPSEE